MAHGTRPARRLPSCSCPRNVSVRRGRTPADAPPTLASERRFCRVHNGDPRHLRRRRRSRRRAWPIRPPRVDHPTRVRLAHRHRILDGLPYDQALAVARRLELANYATVDHVDQLAALDDTTGADAEPVYVELTTPVDRGPPPPADPHITLTLAPNAPNGTGRGDRHAP